MPFLTYDINPTLQMLSQGTKSPIEGLGQGMQNFAGMMMQGKQMQQQQKEFELKKQLMDIQKDESKLNMLNQRSAAEAELANDMINQFGTDPLKFQAGYPMYRKQMVEKNPEYAKLLPDKPPSMDQLKSMQQRSTTFQFWSQQSLEQLKLAQKAKEAGGKGGSSVPEGQIKSHVTTFLDRKRETLGLPEGMEKFMGSGTDWSEIEGGEERVKDIFATKVKTKMEQYRKAGESVDLETISNEVWFNDIVPSIKKNPKPGASSIDYVIGGDLPTTDEVTTGTPSVVSETQTKEPTTVSKNVGTVSVAELDEYAKNNFNGDTKKAEKFLADNGYIVSAKSSDAGSKVSALIESQPDPQFPAGYAAARQKYDKALDKTLGLVEDAAKREYFDDLTTEQMALVMKHRKGELSKTAVKRIMKELESRVNE